MFAVVAAALATGAVGDARAQLAFLVGTDHHGAQAHPLHAYLSALIAQAEAAAPWQKGAGAAIDPPGNTAGFRIK
jgi:hypothetical protein